MSPARLAILLLLVATALAPVAGAACRDACIVAAGGRSGSGDCDAGAPDSRSWEGVEARARVAGRHWTVGATSWCYAYDEPPGPDATSERGHGAALYADTRPEGSADWSKATVSWWEADSRGPTHSVSECHTMVHLENLVLWILDVDRGCPAGGPPALPRLLS